MKIRARVSEATDVPESQIASTKRTHNIAEARFISVWLVKQKTSLRLREIAELHGKASHVPILHALRTVKLRMEVDKKFKKRVGDLASALETEISAMPDATPAAK